MPTEEQDRLPDILRDLRERGDGYASPGADYFTGLAERSLAAAGEPAVKHYPARDRPARFSRWLSVAAAVLLLLVAGWLATGGSDAVTDQPLAGNERLPAGEYPSSDELLAEIDAELIDDYVSEQIDDFTLELYNAVPLND